jgi:hypothetical protein
MHGFWPGYSKFDNRSCLREQDTVHGLRHSQLTLTNLAPDSMLTSMMLPKHSSRFLRLSSLRQELKMDRRTLPPTLSLTTTRPLSLFGSLVVRIRTPLPSSTLASLLFRRHPSLLLRATIAPLLMDSHSFSKILIFRYAFLHLSKSRCPEFRVDFVCSPLGHQHLWARGSCGELGTPSGRGRQRKYPN